jgi:thiol-disulfide isomerase/thioredoxin
MHRGAGEWDVTSAFELPNTLVGGIIVHLRSPRSFAISSPFLLSLSHCKNLAPHYELAAQAFRDVPSGSSLIRVAAVDADAHPSLGQEFGVKGFPTLKYFPAGSLDAQEYQGGRTAAALVEFLNKELKTDVSVPESADYDASAASTAAAKVAFAYPSVLHLTNENIDQHIGGSVPMLVEFYAPWCASVEKNNRWKIEKYGR